MPRRSSQGNGIIIIIPCHFCPRVGRASAHWHDIWKKPPAPWGRRPSARSPPKSRPRPTWAGCCTAGPSAAGGFLPARLPTPAGRLDLDRRPLFPRGLWASRAGGARGGGGVGGSVKPWLDKGDVTLQPCREGDAAGTGRGCAGGEKQKPPPLGSCGRGEGGTRGEGLRLAYGPAAASWWAGGWQGNRRVARLIHPSLLYSQWHITAGAKTAQQPESRLTGHVRIPQCTCPLATWSPVKLLALSSTLPWDSVSLPPPPTTTIGPFAPPSTSELWRGRKGLRKMLPEMDIQIVVVLRCWAAVRGNGEKRGVEEGVPTEEIQNDIKRNDYWEAFSLFRITNCYNQFTEFFRLQTSSAPPSFLPYIL